MRFLSIVRDAPSEKRPVAPPPDIPDEVAEISTETAPETPAGAQQDDTSQLEAVETQPVAAPATDE